MCTTTTGLALPLIMVLLVHGGKLWDFILPCTSHIKQIRGYAFSLPLCLNLYIEYLCYCVSFCLSFLFWVCLFFNLLHFCHCNYIMCTEVIVIYRFWRIFCYGLSRILDLGAQLCCKISLILIAHSVNYPHKAIRFSQDVQSCEINSHILFILTECT